MAGGGTSLIEILLASPTWRTSTGFGGDHYIMQMVINDRVLYKDLRPARVNLNTPNWNSFHVKFLSQIAQGLPLKELEENSRFITDCIAGAATDLQHSRLRRHLTGTTTT